MSFRTAFSREEPDFRQQCRETRVPRVYPNPQILPRRIILTNQSDLLFPTPCLNLGLPRNRVSHMFEALKPYQPVNAILPRKGSAPLRLCAAALATSMPQSPRRTAPDSCWPAVNVIPPFSRHPTFCKLLPASLADMRHRIFGSLPVQSSSAAQAKSRFLATTRIAFATPLRSE
jgi:hypothetical protein